MKQYEFSLLCAEGHAVYRRLVLDVLEDVKHADCDCGAPVRVIDCLPVGSDRPLKKGRLI